MGRPRQRRSALHLRGRPRALHRLPARRHRLGRLVAVGQRPAGRLVDPQPAGRCRAFNGYSHFAIKAEQDGKLLDARVLNGPYEGNPAGSPGARKMFDGFGQGANRNTLVGRAAFRAMSTFIGRFPVADVVFHDERFPGRGAADVLQPVHPAQ